MTQPCSDRGDRNMRIYQQCRVGMPKLVEAENRVMLVVAKKYDILYRLWFLYHSLFSFMGGSFRGA